MNTRKRAEDACLMELKLFEMTLELATGEAYRNRHTIRWVKVTQKRHDSLAEAHQVWAEARHRAAIDSGVLPGRSLPARGPNGEAPSIKTVFGYELIIDDTVDDVEWDVGQPTTFDFDIKELFGDE